SGEVVIYLQGRAPFAGDPDARGPRLLVDAVCRNAGVQPGQFADLASFCRRLGQERGDASDRELRLVLVLDALDEADRFTDLVEALDAFLPALRELRWVRLVVSMRTGAYHALARRHRRAGRHGPEVFAHAHLLRSFALSQHESVPYLELRPFRPQVEGEAAYRLRQEHLRERACAL